MKLLRVSFPSRIHKTLSIWKWGGRHILMTQSSFFPCPVSRSLYHVPVSLQAGQAEGPLKHPVGWTYEVYTKYNCSSDSSAYMNVIVVEPSLHTFHYSHDSTQVSLVRTIDTSIWVASVPLTRPIHSPRETQVDIQMNRNSHLFSHRNFISILPEASVNINYNAVT